MDETGLALIKRMILPRSAKDTSSMRPEMEWPMMGPAFGDRMIRVIVDLGERTLEDRRRFFERHSMILEIVGALGRIPLEHGASHRAVGLTLG